jgi:hypothetical protein
VDDAVAVLTRVPLPAVTRTTIVRCAVAPAARVPAVAVTVPVVPTAGPEQVPGTASQETKVVPDGSGSVIVSAAAGSGPRFATETVYVRF